MFTYSSKNERIVSRLSRRHPRRYAPGKIEPVAILETLQNCGRGWDDIPDMPINELLYNALMLLRDENSQVFPAHDLSLLAANALMLEPAAIHGKQLAVLDWQMLPSAILVSGSFSDIWLPFDDANPSIARHIGDELAGLFPAITIHSARSENWPLPADAAFLGWDILAHCEKDQSFLDRLADIGTGVFITSQDFLGLANNAHIRFLFLESGLLAAVMQLPMPKKAFSSIYPALVKLDRTAKNKVRFARANSIDNGAPNYDQAAILGLLLEDSQYSIAVPKNAVGATPDCTFMPAAYFSRKIRQSQEVITKLGDRALVLRCQLSRQKFDDPTGLAIEAGSSLDGRYVAREITMSACDPITGFVDPYAGNMVSLRMSPLGNDGKYLLRRNDIIMPFRGGLSSIGRPGFVGGDISPSVTGLGLCIIRALPGLDPIWLYYYLQRRDCREYLQGMAKGSALWVLNMQAIKDLPVYSPDDGEIEAVLREHRLIAVNMSDILIKQRLNRQALEKIVKMGEAAEKAEGL